MILHHPQNYRDRTTVIKQCAKTLKDSGYTFKEIADKLSLSVRTIESYFRTKSKRKYHLVGLDSWQKKAYN